MKRKPIPYRKRFLYLTKSLEDRFIQVKAFWDKFVSGREGIDLATVPDDILKAWRRSRNIGLNPFKKPIPPVLSDARLWTLREAHERLLQSAGPMVDTFCRLREKSRCLICLFDTNGYLLDVRAEDHYRQLAKSLRLIPGALWSEKNVGANAFALAVSLNKPVRFFGPQHYMRAYHGECVSAAPVCDIDGTAIGGIALISSICDEIPSSLAVVASLAQAVENDLRKKNTQAAADAYWAIVQNIPDALIALNSAGTITLMNQAARKLLRIGKNADGLRLRDFLDPGNLDFFKILESDKPVVNAGIHMVSSLGLVDVSVTVNPIYGASRETVGKMVILKELPNAKKWGTSKTGARAPFQLKDICGQNKRFLRVLRHVELAAQSESNVLLLGESGTGKDVFAQAIHTGGARREGPYLAINCASIPRDLIASELFGHQEGAFTGSRRGGNTGKFEAADGGTIFFDEIAETSLEFQAALLRAVEEKAIVRVGASSSRPVDVRIIAATNKNILEEIRKGTFRSDLYYRLNVFTLETIPLRERKDDIPLLIENFLQRYANVSGRRITRFTDGVIKILTNYPWPGNIRELQNVIERMINVAQQGELTVDLIPDEILHWQYKDDYIPQDASKKHVEKEAIVRMLNMEIPRNKIAQKMGMPRSTFYRKLKEYGLV